RSDQWQRSRAGPLRGHMQRRLLADESICEARLLVRNHSRTPEIYTLSLHDALPISGGSRRRARRSPRRRRRCSWGPRTFAVSLRSEEHTSELQSQSKLVCRLLLEKNKVGDLNPALDLEATGGLGTSALQSWVGSCLK